MKNLIYYCKFCLKLKGVKPNQFFDVDVANDSSLAAFKVSGKLAALLQAQAELTNKTQQQGGNNRTISALSAVNNNNNNSNNNINSPMSNSNLEKYKLDEKKSVFPIFF